MIGTADYSRLDRLLHRIAFSQIGMQKRLAEMEDDLFAGALAPAVDRPVFVTSLPRAGTTLLLEVIAALPEFASHTYRQMPFVLSPLIWDRLSRGFRRTAELNERSHGDGMTVGFDSPEAFEEVVWKAFWPTHYGPDRIAPWTASDRNAEFEDFISRHIRKIVGLGGPDASRYVSKNNANVARLDLLTAIFPEAVILVPVRNPADHVRSLRRQHERFLKLHAEDRFGLNYMQWLGHFEFGAALRPIDFGGWLGVGPASDASSQEFWMAYWAEAFSAVLSNPDPRIHIVDYDGLCADPAPVLAALASTIGASTPADLIGQANRLRPPTSGDRSAGRSAGLPAGVEAIHAQLLARAIATAPPRHAALDRSGARTL